MARLSGLLESLVALVRSGWMLGGVPGVLGESVAEHSYVSAVVALEVGLRARERGVGADPFRAAAYALVHDLGEAVIGDVARGGVERGCKLRAERDALESLVGRVALAGLALDYSSGCGSVECVVARIGELLATAWRGFLYARRGYEGVVGIACGSLSEALELADGAGLGGVVEEVAGELGLLEAAAGRCGGR